MATELILASASPRRRELLTQIGVAFRCIPAAIDESPRSAEKPGDYVRRMALEKARAVNAGAASGCAVLAADTIVVVDDVILGKPVDRGDALSMLARLSGSEHRVMTALCLIHGTTAEERLVETTVEFRNLDLATCDAYLATDEPWDKAGAYAIQGLAGVFVRTIHGSYSNVVGLPLAETYDLLAACGVATALAGEATAGTGERS